MMLPNIKKVFKIEYVSVLYILLIFRALQCFDILKILFGVRETAPLWTS